MDGPWYGQRQEDRHISQFLGEEAKKSNGFYVNVGAWEPTLDSVTKHFYDRGWRGINIEPVKQYYDALTHERTGDINLRMLCGRDDIDAFEFHVGPGTGLSTCVPEYAEKFGMSEVDTVPMRRLSKIVRMYVPQDREIDFLAIDVEGFERQVLLGFFCDPNIQRPRLILLEATEPGTSDDNAIPTHDKWEYILFQNGYHCHYYDGLNRYYLQK